MQNVEFKTELRDLELARMRCLLMGARHEGTFTQTDTYFRVPDGRLKKREIEGEAPVWIFYHRPDRVTPKVSYYTVYSDSQAKARWGILPMREWVTVRKMREVYLLENIRIHLDRVSDLGTFMEVESVVSPKHSVAKCHEQIRQLREDFGPILGEPIGGSYSDLLDRVRREAETE